MICDACQNQPNCLPSQLSQADPQIRQLLNNLKSCDVQNQRFQQAGQTHGPRTLPTPSTSNLALPLMGDRLLNWLGDRLLKRLVC